MLRLLHVDDHPVIRKAAQEVLEAEFEELEYTGVDSHKKGLDALSQSPFDVILLDLLINGDFKLHQIKRFTEQVPTIVWSMRYNYGIIRTVVDYGARGVIGKHEPVDTIARAIRAVIHSRTFFLSAEGQGMLAAGGLSSAYMPPGYYDLRQLSAREIEVLRLAGQGFCIKDSAHLLNIKPKTLETFRRRVREKLNLGSSGELLRFAVRWVSEGQPSYLHFPQHGSSIE